LSTAGEQGARTGAGMRAQESRVQLYQEVYQAESKTEEYKYIFMDIL